MISQQLWLLLLGVGCVSVAVEGADAAAGQRTTHELLALDEVRSRAAAWPNIAIEPISDSPRVFIVRSVLAKEEVDELVSLAQTEWSSLNEARGKKTGIVSLDRSELLNTSSVVQNLNQRLATLSGVTPEHVEEGYFTVYNPGHEQDHLHVDNHQQTMKPRRSVSFVIQLMTAWGGQKEMLPCGQTVFPLLGTGSSPPGGGVVDASDLATWDDLLQTSWKDFSLGEDAQKWRICPAKGSGDFQQQACESTWERAQRLCNQGGPEAVKLNVGDAVMFSNMNGQDVLTAETIHGSCGVSESLQGPKIIMSKFLREGPRHLWPDSQQAFDQALAEHKKRQKQSQEL